MKQGDLRRETLFKIIIFIASKKGKRVTSAEVQQRFEIRETTSGWFNTRALIKDAMRCFGAKLGLPIGADARGYFLITTEEGLSEYVENLNGRIWGIQERIALVESAARNRSCLNCLD